MKNMFWKAKLMKSRFAVATVAGVIVIGVSILIGSTIGRMSGERAAAISADRLVLVWPSFGDLPLEDRALLVGLAMTCHVEQRPAVAKEVVSCLRSALDDPKAMLPTGLDSSSARARFASLLHQQNA